MRYEIELLELCEMWGVAIFEFPTIFLRREKIKQKTRVFAGAVELFKGIGNEETFEENHIWKASNYEAMHHWVGSQRTQLIQKRSYRRSCWYLYLHEWKLRRAIFCALKIRSAAHGTFQRENIFQANSRCVHVCFDNNFARGQRVDWWQRYGLYFLFRYVLPFTRNAVEWFLSVANLNTTLASTHISRLTYTHALHVVWYY